MVLLAFICFVMQLANCRLPRLAWEDAFTAST